MESKTSVLLPGKGEPRKDRNDTEGNATTTLRKHQRPRIQTPQIHSVCRRLPVRPYRPHGGSRSNKGKARFLGYEIGIINRSDKFDNQRRRVVNGKVGMYIPEDVMQTKRKRYLRDDKPIHRPELLNDSEYDIITRYQGEYRGLVHYYGLAQNLAQLGSLRGTMATSLLKTLAGKHQTSG